MKKLHAVYDKNTRSGSKGQPLLRRLNSYTHIPDIPCDCMLTKRDWTHMWHRRRLRRLDEELQLLRYSPAGDFFV